MDYITQTIKLFAISKKLFGNKNNASHIKEEAEGSTCRSDTRYSRHNKTVAEEYLNAFHGRS